ncbi:MAG: NapC/NirT family cytochrome c [Chloroflexi bacterium]|nr:NapC/NirT family cytochrome c [Chloroflexota bacterium]
MTTLQQTAGASRVATTLRLRPHLILNAITILGALVACAGIGGAGFALAAGFLEEDPSAIKGILGYVVMPSLALGGVALMVTGMLVSGWRQARAAAALGERPRVHLEVGNWNHLFGIATFGVIAIGSLTVLGGTTYRAIEFMESTTFCGTCHQVMQPQVEAHLTSPHAEVECTKCHIAYRSGPLGPNTNAYINAKIGGLRQTVSVMTGAYDTPIRAPSAKIPATNTTCEGCHAPTKNFGVVIKQFDSYSPDEQNSRHTRLLAFKVGSGRPGEGDAIHWHATAKVWYRATDESRTVISWVGVEKPGGLEEWTNPNAPVAGEPEERQLMSCIDCHNRVGHRIPTPDELVDQALDDGRIDSSLPFIKREAVNLLGGNGEGADPDTLAARFRQPTWFDQLAGFYNENYPELAATRRDAVRGAIEELKMIADQILYPDMSADWLTYPDNLSHRLPEGIKTAAGDQNPGCFRCHGTVVKPVTGELLKGTMGGDSCLACHGFGEGTQLQISQGAPSQEQGCALCHVNVSQPEIAGMPPDAGDSPALPTDQLHQR